MTPGSTAQESEEKLVADIRKSEDRSHVVDTTLQTDEQVIARVTDGIYRQPGSALRELISNAYDADATRVVIKTDAPRFGRITIEDDGHGMTPEVLAHLLLHIGGSAKRSAIGAKLGVTDSDDLLRSPGGRRLIGKIGIGLFSVSQLTHSFQIITKTKGDPHRTIATVALRQFSDLSSSSAKSASKQFESGKVKIWREKAADLSAHGTTIALTSIRPQASDTLRSRDIWSVIEHNEQIAANDERQTIEPPRYHIGRVDSSGQFLKKTGSAFANFPWADGAKPEEAFRSMVDAVWGEIEQSNPNPQLSKIFDYYLQMIWQLALAVPLQYVGKPLFDEPCSDWATVYQLSNQSKGAAQQIKSDKTIRKALSLKEPHEPQGNFEVLIDNLTLRRPIRFRDLPTTNHALKRPLVFVGKCTETFSKVKAELSGGPLSFEAYLFWTPKVAPTEHQGSLIRIHGSSGTLFDPTFMRYQVSELTRLRQITCEIFVSQGLDSALNIDRESFNSAHPHAVFITKWLHEALRQLATAQKREASEVRQRTRQKSTSSQLAKIQRVAEDVWEHETDDSEASPPTVEFTETGKKSTRNADTYVYPRAKVLGATADPKKTRGNTPTSMVEEKMKGIVQVLAAFGLLDGLSKKRQENLLSAIRTILSVPDK